MKPPKKINLNRDLPKIRKSWSIDSTTKIIPAKKGKGSTYKREKSNLDQEE